MVPSWLLARPLQPFVGHVWHATTYCQGRLRMQSNWAGVASIRSKEEMMPTIAIASNVSSQTVQPLHQERTEELLALDQLGALVQKFRNDAPPAVVDWMSETVEMLKREHRDRAALLKRSWSDSPFEDGEEGNEKTITQFELELMGMLRSTNQGLADGTVLGNAIDLAGAYKKNYKLEQAEAVLLRCTRHTEERSGAWMVKYLNHLSQVRMKQSRDVEAMEMMYEMESLATFSLDEPGASEFFETLYRNMSSGLRRMGREDEAAIYFLKMADAARRHKERLDWMDLWDLGLLVANRAFHSKRWAEFHRSREIIAEALKQQREVEPNELILRAKVLSNLGQCYLATDELLQAEVYYSEAYELFSRTVGKRSPLFGMQAWASGNLRCAERRHSEALFYLGEAFYVEVVKDGLSVSEMNKLLDQILLCLHEGRSTDSATDENALNLGPTKRALKALLEDPRWEELEDSTDLGVLSHKLSLASLGCWPGTRSPAAEYSEKAVALLEDGGQESRHWLSQAQAVKRTLQRAA